MKKCILYNVILLCLFFSGIGATQAAEGDLTDLTGGDPFYYTLDQHIAEEDGQSKLLGVGRPDRTHSQIPHLPVFHGYMSTNYTYRFVNIAEQVFTMIGEGKHGLWRAHESGFVREYLKPGKKPLPEGADLFADKNQAIIENHYSHFIPEAGFDGYYYPDQRLNESGGLNYIDLPITHPKYDGKYLESVAIDQSMFYCTMSGANFPYAKRAMEFAFAQDGANQIGPLGKKAGLHVKENYPSVLRLKHFPDANTWINVGVEGKDETHVQWKPIDNRKTKAEYYLVERPFFNTPYLFLIGVYENVDNRDLEYIRPDGAYYEAVKQNNRDLKTEVTLQPRFHFQDGTTDRAVGLPIYGVHHPDRKAFDGGGACPMKGGDWGRYPDSSGGAAWPTTYEEVTPLCDAVLVDIKFYSNLDGRDWDDKSKYLANAGVGKKTVTYKMQPGDYGEFTDPYLKENGIRNPERQNVPAELTLTYTDVPEPVSYNMPEGLNDPASNLNPVGTSCRPIGE